MPNGDSFSRRCRAVTKNENDKICFSLSTVRSNQMSQTRNTADKVWWPPALVVVPDHCFAQFEPYPGSAQDCCHIKRAKPKSQLLQFSMFDSILTWFLRPSQNGCMIKPRASTTGCTSFTCCVITRCYLLIKCLKPAILPTRFDSLLRRWWCLIIA